MPFFSVYMRRTQFLAGHEEKAWKRWRGSIQVSLFVSHGFWQGKKKPVKKKIKKSRRKAWVHAFWLVSLSSRLRRGLQQALHQSRPAILDRLCLFVRQGARRRLSTKMHGSGSEAKSRSMAVCPGQVVLLSETRLKWGQLQDVALKALRFVC